MQRDTLGRVMLQRIDWMSYPLYLSPFHILFHDAQALDPIPPPFTSSFSQPSKHTGYRSRFHLPPPRPTQPATFPIHNQILIQHSNTATCTQIPSSKSPFSPVAPILVATSTQATLISSLLYTAFASMPRLKHHKTPFFQDSRSSNEAFGLTRRRTFLRNPSRRNN